MKLIRRFLTMWFYLLGRVTWALIDEFDPQYGYPVYNYFILKSYDFDKDRWFWKGVK